MVRHIGCFQTAWWQFTDIISSFSITILLHLRACVLISSYITCLLWLSMDPKQLVSVFRHLWETGAEQDRNCAAGSGVPCHPTVQSVCAMCLCWCCVCLRLRTSTGQRTTTAPSIMALFQLVHATWSSVQWKKCIGTIVTLASEVCITDCCISQDFHGVQEVQPIRQKVPGTKMEKDWASGMCSVTRKAKSNRMRQGIPPVRATIKSRWGVWTCREQESEFGW